MSVCATFLSRPTPSFVSSPLSQTTVAPLVLFPEQSEQGNTPLRGYRGGGVSVEP